jgi:purine-nucleoside/S-methyl-5'-thioadenosine phosphorylase / adenosine deaminase
MLIPHGAPPAYFTFASFEAMGLPHATTTRHFPAVTAFASGASPFRDDAAMLLRETGLQVERAAYARQVHRADAVPAPAGGGFAGAADVLVTGERGVPLTIVTADCLAITLWDREAPALAAAHVGWRGTVHGAAQAAVRALERAGGRAAHALATVGPSIGPCCYEVDGPVIASFSEAYPDLWERWAISAGPGRWMLDLWSANEDLLVRAGIPRERIDSPRLCTACHLDLFYSYRKGSRGRLLTIAALP